MSNDNDKPDEKVVPFRKKTIKKDNGKRFASVYFKDGVIGLELQEETLLLNARMALELAFILLMAVRCKIDTTTGENNG